MVRIIHCGDYNNGPSLCGIQPEGEGQMFTAFRHAGDDVVVGYRLFAKWMVDNSFENSKLCEECSKSPDTALYVLRYLETENGP